MKAFGAIYKRSKKMSEKIMTEGAPEPVGAYPHARIEGDFIFLSGVGPREKGTKVIPGVTLNKDEEIINYDVEIQTESVVNNVRMILESMGKSLNDVIDVQVFLTNMKKDFKTFNKVYAKHFTNIGATRTTIEVGALPTPIAVEFKVIAKA